MLARNAESRMTFEEYLVWEAKQEEKWELVDGRPVRRSDRWHYDEITGMAGATYEHNRIVGNLIRHLGNRLAGKPCWPLPSDLKTRSKDNARYPDVTVECGKPARGSLLSAEPRVVFEVLSKSNTMREQLLLLDDYQRVDSVMQVVYVEQYSPHVLSWTRQDMFWPRENLDGLDGSIRLPSLDISLPLTDIYEGLDFDDEFAA